MFFFKFSKAVFSCYLVLFGGSEKIKFKTFPSAICTEELFDKTMKKVQKKSKKVKPRFFLVFWRGYVFFFHMTTLDYFDDFPSA